MCMPNFQHTLLIQFNLRNWQPEFAGLGNTLTGMTLLSYFSVVRPLQNISPLQEKHLREDPFG